MKKLYSSAVIVIVFLMAFAPMAHAAYYPDPYVYNIEGQVLGASTNGLVGYWNFDEGSGNTASDTSGSGNNAVNSNIIWADGKFGKAASFSSGTNKLVVTDNNSLDFGAGSFSISAWIYTTNSTWSMAFNKGGVGGGAGYGMGLSNGKVYCPIQADTGVNQQFTGVRAVGLNQWQHIVCVFNRGDKIYSYLNGTADSSGVYLAGNDGSVSNSVNPTIGSYYSGSMAFQGQIDDVRVYNRVLTAQDVQDIYNDDHSAPSSPPPSSPTADTVPPTVSLTSPSSGDTVSGTLNLSASASDNVSVAGVLFKVDGTNISSEDSSAPYTMSWDTTAIQNGSHSLVAVARDAAGNLATSASINITVNNVSSSGSPVPEWVYQQFSDPSVSVINMPAGTYRLVKPFKLKRSNVTINFNGTTLLVDPTEGKQSVNVFDISAPSYTSPTYGSNSIRTISHLTGQISSGTTQLTMDPAEIVGVQPGEGVLIWAGVTPTDPVEPESFIPAIVSSVNSSTGVITFTQPLGKDIKNYGSLNGLNASVIPSQQWKVGNWGNVPPATSNFSKGYGLDHGLERFVGGMAHDITINNLAFVVDAVPPQTFANGLKMIEVTAVNNITFNNLSIHNPVGSGIHAWRTFNMLVNGATFTGNGAGRVWNGPIPEGIAFSAWGGEKLTYRNVSIHGNDISVFNTEVGSKDIWLDGLDYDVVFTSARTYPNSIVLNFNATRNSPRVTNASIKMVKTGGSGGIFYYTYYAPDFDGYLRFIGSSLVDYFDFGYGKFPKLNGTVQIGGIIYGPATTKTQTETILHGAPSRKVILPEGLYTSIRFRLKNKGDLRSVNDSFGNGYWSTAAQAGDWANLAPNSWYTIAPGDAALASYLGKYLLFYMNNAGSTADAVAEIEYTYLPKSGGTPTPPSNPSPTPTPNPTPSPTPTPTPTPIPNLNPTDPTLPPTLTPTPPGDDTTKPVVTPTPSDVSSRAVKLINSSGTYYLIIANQRHGITNPGMLNSYGFRFEDAKPAAAADIALPEGDLLLPGNGSLVKSKEDPTVYLISKSKRYAFTSAKVFQSLGFKFSSVLVVTNPELQVLSKQPNIDNGAVAHLPGTDINRNGTVYWVGEDNQLHGYPSLEVYNSWHIKDDFSRVVPANSADNALIVGELVGERILN